MDFKTFIPSKDRPGIASAVETVILRIKDGEKTTAIVLPPRYGKSDAIRLTAIEAKYHGLISTAVILTPWVALRDQIKDPERIDAMVKRCCNGAPIAPQAIATDVLSGAFSWDFNEEGKGRSFWVTTIPQAAQPASLLSLTQAATFYKEKHMPPLLLMVDECHLVGANNTAPAQWGNIVKECISSGAHVALFTGTPERSDNTGPFGFRMEELSREEENWYSIRKEDDGTKWADLISGYAITRKIESDFSVHLRDVWAQEHPIILQHLEPRWFGFEVDGEKIEDICGGKEIRFALAKGLRQDSTIKEAMRIGIEDMLEKRNVVPDSAAIVFVGNDVSDKDGCAIYKDDNGDGTDYHARLAKRIGKQIFKRITGRDAKIFIATMNADAGGDSSNDSIDRFCKGDGDILIVKRMGTVGLDAPRINTGIDLCTSRGVSDTMQRWFRMCTSCGGQRFSTVVLPNDQITKALWKLIVEGNGGDYKVHEDGSLVKSTLIKDKDRVKIDIDIGDAYAAGVSDPLTKKSIDADMDIEVSRFLHAAPQMIGRMSRVEISDLIKKGLLNIPTIEDVASQTVVVDIVKERAEIMKRINSTVQDITHHVVPYTGENGFLFGEQKAKIYSTICARAGIPRTLKACRDLDKLRLAEQEAEQLAREHGVRK